MPKMHVELMNIYFVQFWSIYHQLLIFDIFISFQISASSANTLSDFWSAIVIKKNSDNWSISEV